MYEDAFRERLIELRMRKGVSSRDMSLSIGQNAGYINNIENGKSLPSMKGFFYICEYFNISPGEFFDLDNRDPETVSVFEANCKRLSASALRILTELIQELIHS